MKGINLKKIGAIVAGATILASSVAFAGSVLHGNTALVTDSGQPVATVVVGSGASASDGVAAANIATHLASEAFMTSTYTAMAGDVSCVASEAEGAGSCVITDKSVTLDVTVPGATVTGSHTMNTLIGDYVDRTLGNRAQGSQQEVYNLSTTETSEFANPNANGAGSALSGAPSAQFLHRISGSDFAPMATYTMNDEDASTSYTQTQDFWVGSTSNGGNVQWDGSEDALVLDLPIVEYSLDFSGSGNDFGIPVCTQAVNGSFYADCETNSGSTLDNSYATSSHKVKLMFLGEEWIISDMSPPTTGSLTSVQTLQNGGYVKIAKESQQGILNKGEFLTVGDLKFVLDDVSLATGAANLHPAIVSVYAEGVEDALKEAQINPDTTQDVSVPGYGTYKIHVYKTAPGYTFGATWADMAVFSDELKLEDGQDVDADLGNNDLWEVSLGWKNRGAGDSGDDGMADHLRTIIIHTDDADDAPGLDDWVAGESLAVIQDPAAWQLSFAGLDIDDDDR